MVAVLVIAVVIVWQALQCSMKTAWMLRETGRDCCKRRYCPWLLPTGRGFVLGPLQSFEELPGERCLRGGPLSIPWDARARRPRSDYGRPPMGFMEEPYGIIVGLLRDSVAMPE